jgi:hypothetical protein
MSFIYRKKTNPEHHNYGRPQSPKARFMAAVNWWRFQLKSVQGTLSPHHVQFSAMGRKLLTREADETLSVLLTRQRNLLAELRELEREIADWQATDKWVN